MVNAKRIDEIEGFDAATNPYIKARQDAKAANGPRFKALYDDMWEILGEDDPKYADHIIQGDEDYSPLSHSIVNGSVVFTGTMDDFEKFFFKFGITGSEFADWFNNNTDREVEKDWSHLGQRKDSIDKHIYNNRPHRGMR